jgi:hypothetical protein
VCTGGSLRAWKDLEVFQPQRVEPTLGPGASRLSERGSSNGCGRRHAPELQPGMQRPSDLGIVALERSSFTCVVGTQVITDRRASRAASYYSPAAATRPRDNGRRPTRSIVYFAASAVALVRFLHQMMVSAKERDGWS